MTDAHVAPQRRRPFGLAGILRRHQRRPGPGLLAALLTVLATLFVLAAPRLEGRAYDRALGDAMASQPPAMRDIVLNYSGRTLGTMMEGDIRGAVFDDPIAPFFAVNATARDALGPALRYLAGVTHSAETDPMDIVSTNPAQRRQAVVRIQSDFDRRVRWDQGRAASDSTRTVPMDAETFGRKLRWDSPVIPVGMLTATAKEWGVQIGDRFELTPFEPRGIPTMNFVVEVVGTYTPLDPRDVFWQAQTGMIQTGYVSVAGNLGGAVERAFLITGDRNYGALGSALDPQPINPFTGVDPLRGTAAVHHEWRYALDQHRVTRQAVPALQEGLAGLANVQRWNYVQPSVRSGLEKIFTTYQRAIGVTAALVLFPALAGMLLSSLVLGLIGYLLIERRAPALRLLRVRGAGSGQILRLALTEAALWPVPAWLIAVAIIRWRVPGQSPRWSVAMSLAPPAVTLIVVGVLALSAANRPLRAMAAGSAAAQARRVVVELLVLALAYFTIGSLRSRADLIGAGQRDWYAALAPVAAALAVAVIVLRLYPPPIRWLARLAARGRSVHGFLGLARSARDRGAALIPLVAILLAAALGSYLTAVDRSIAHERVVAAYRSTGADVRVDTERLDPKDLAALRARPGVRAVVPAYVARDIVVAGRPGEGAERVTLIATDLDAYAAALRETPLAFDVPATEARLDGGRLPTLSGTPLRTDAAASTLEFAAGRVIPIRLAGVQDGLNRASAVTTQPVVAVSFALLHQVQSTLQPNTAFVMADERAAGHLETTRPTVLTTGVVNRYQIAGQIADSALPTLVRRLSALAMGLALVFAPLALLLLLAVTRPARDQLILRLRTMGLRRGGEWRLSAVEVLPLAVAGILPGLGAGWYLTRLLGPVIDLGPYTGSAAHPVVRFGLMVPLAIGSGLLLLAALAIVLDVRRARRSRLAEHLRAGETT